MVVVDSMAPARAADMTALRKTARAFTLNFDFIPNLLTPAAIRFVASRGEAATAICQKIKVINQPIPNTESAPRITWYGRRKFTAIRKTTQSQAIEVKTIYSVTHAPPPALSNFYHQLKRDAKSMFRKNARFVRCGLSKSTKSITRAYCQCPVEMR